MICYKTESNQTNLILEFEISVLDSDHECRALYYSQSNITTDPRFLNIDIYDITKYNWFSIMLQKSLSSSSYRTICMDIPDPLSPHLPIVHCFRQILRATSRIGTELLYVDSNWTSCLCLSMWRGPLEYIIPYFSSSVPHVWFI